MIGTGSALIAAAVLFLLLWIWIRTDASSRELPLAPDEWLPGGGEGAEACPPEFVSRIFSGDDLAFVWRLDSPGLKRQFRRERHAVALLWVQQTSAAVRRIMRRHLEASRASQDLEFAVEVRVFLQYAQLRVICGVLFLLVGLAGPERLRGMALYTHRLTQSIGGVLREFESGARAREISGAGPY